MQLIGLEEHFVTPDVLGAWLALPREQRDLAVDASDQGEVQQRLRDLGNARLRYMDGAGIAMQVLSLTAPGVHGLEPQLACRLARRSNDLVAATVRAHPDRTGSCSRPTIRMPGWRRTPPSASCTSLVSARASRTDRQRQLEPAVRRHPARPERHEKLSTNDSWAHCQHLDVFKPDHHPDQEPCP